jgi:hypothetical protein
MKNVLNTLLVLALAASVSFAGSAGIDKTDTTPRIAKQCVTVLDAITATPSTLDGETLADNTVDEDSIDFGTGTDQVDIDDLTLVVDVGNTTNYTVLAANSGQTHIIPAITADTTFTMPAEAAGLYYKFVNATGAAEAQDWTFDTGANANYFVGGVVQFDEVGAQTNSITYYFSDGNSNSKLGVLTPTAGTVIEMWCTDGTTWYVSGTVHSTTDTGVTFADQ